MVTVLQLESFDTRRERAARSPTEPSRTGYEEGYVAGIATAEANFAKAQTQLQQDLVYAAQTAMLTLEDAQTGVVDAVLPLLSALLEKVLPEVTVPVLHEQLRHLAMQALAADAQTTLTLKVPTQQVAAVSAALSEVDADRLQVVADPALSGAAAWMVTSQGETALDVDAALAAISETVQSTITLHAQMTEASLNGRSASR